MDEGNEHFSQEQIQMANKQKSFKVIYCKSEDKYTDSQTINYFTCKLLPIFKNEKPHSLFFTHRPLFHL